MKQNLIEIQHLSKTFSRKASQTPAKKAVADGALFALHDVNLKIPEGSIYGIIGMSGAGKTTLLRCLTGLEIPSSGSILFEGAPLPYGNQKALRQFRRKIGMVFQHFPALLLPYSCRKYWLSVRFPVFLSCEREERIDELLSLVELKKKETPTPLN